MSISLHRLALVEILDKAQVQGTATILVALELLNGRLGSIGTVESNNARSAGAATGLILDFGLLDLADGGEELDQIVVASRPG